MLVIELNEFDPDYLLKNAKKLNLRNIEYFLNLQHTETITEEKIEHQGLDPWVQWVSIHCGKPMKEHKIKRLGETKIQKDEQIWNKISKFNGVKWGVWGVMNAPCGGYIGRSFFVPDPWSFDEKAYPHSLERFLALPRYFAKNYLSPNLYKTIFHFSRSLTFFVQYFDFVNIIKIFKVFVRALFSTGLNNHSLTTILDYINCLYFIKFKIKYKTEFSLIFLNHIAHLQHNTWDKDGKNMNQMIFGLKICDKILGELKKYSNLSEPIILLNGLRQINVANKGYFVYRQKNPDQFIKIVCPFECEVQQNMTNDGTLLFNDIYSANEAEKLLRNLKLKIDKTKLLFVERLDELKIFYQLDFEKKIKLEEKILLKNSEINFFDYFELVIERTGAHVPSGDIFSRNILLPNKMMNHQIFYHIEDYFNSKKFF